MPFAKVGTNTPVITSRVLLVGAPNTQKTTALLTCPHPVAIVSLPGEKGHATAVGHEGVDVYTWTVDNPETVAPHQIVKEMEQLTYELVAGKHGEYHTVALDGIHKAFGWFYRRARLDVESWGATTKMTEDNKNLIAYNPAYDMFQLWLTRLLQSRVPYLWATVWEGPTKDNPDDKSLNASTHLFPDLPGKMARWIVGEFSATLYCEADPPLPNGTVRARWTTKPVGKVWGVGVKMSPAKAQALPATLPNTFQALAQALGEPT